MRSPCNNINKYFVTTETSAPEQQHSSSMHRQGCFMLCWVGLGALTAVTNVHLREFLAKAMTVYSFNPPANGQK